MTAKPTVQRLLERVLESGATVEAVCAEWPELIGEVRERWRQLQEVRHEIDMLFPAAARIGEDPPDESGAGPGVLPQIDGYEITALVGRGGMGIVYRARQLALQRTVAIKMLPHAYAGATEMARFRREAELVGQLQHPNIVQVHHVGGEGKWPFFAMEFVDGGNLAQRLHRAPMPPRAAAAMLATLASAVEVAHRAGIVHRDLKPINVLLTSDGVPKITDFGLARRMADDSELTQSGVKLGTPGYMPPELARGDRNTGVAGDVYSLGAILYEMLTGRPPFRADTTEETLRQVLEEEPARPARLNAKVPRDLETICLRCLHKLPRRRYPSACALAEDLGRFLADEPIAARPTGAFERGARWVRRHPSKAMAMAFTALLSAAGIGGAVWVAERRHALAREVDADLDEARHFEHRGDWAAAATALQRAQLRIGDGGELRARVAVAEGALALVRRLQAIRSQRADSVSCDFALAQTSAAYAAAFAGAGLGGVGSDSDAFGAAVGASDIRTALVDALDDWAFCEKEPARRDWILATARRADPDSWRDHLRDPAAWDDVEALAALAHATDAAAQPVQLQLMLAGLLEIRGRDPLPSYRRLQFANPGDFWANFTLAQALKERGNAEAIVYYRIATALRPDAIAACVNLAIVLEGSGAGDEAMEWWRKALRMAPESGVVRANLATAFLNRGQLAEAEEHARHAIDHLPEREVPSLTWFVLAKALRLTGRCAEAMRLIDRALALLPADGPVRDFGTAEAAACRAQWAREQRLAAVLRGEASADPAEELEFAKLLVLERRYAEALRFFTSSFAADPALAAGWNEYRRYNAACAAARAAGQATAADAAGSMRTQGCAWLAADLDEIELQVDAVDAAERRLIGKHLADWRTDPDLATLRDPAELERLTAAERERLAALWQRVDALQRRAQQGR